jgi:hypothetical protein
MRDETHFQINQGFQNQINSLVKKQRLLRHLLTGIAFINIILSLIIIF